MRRVIAASPFSVFIRRSQGPQRFQRFLVRRARVARQCAAPSLRPFGSPTGSGRPGVPIGLAARESHRSGRDKYNERGLDPEYSTFGRWNGMPGNFCVCDRVSPGGNGVVGVVEGCVVLPDRPTGKRAAGIWPGVGD